MEDQAQRSTEQKQQAPPPRSQLDRLTEQIRERASQAEATLSISACRKLIDILEAKQLDLAMASIADEFDPQHNLADKAKFEAFSELIGIFGSLIAEKQREGEQA